MSSILSGLLLALWAVILLSNDLFGISLFTRIRTAAMSPQSVGKALGTIRVPDVDPVEQLKKDAPGDLAAALGFMIEHAKMNADKRIVIGLDHIILDRVKPDMSSGGDEGFMD